MQSKDQIDLEIGEMYVWNVLEKVTEICDT